MRAALVVEDEKFAMGVFKAVVRSLGFAPLDAQNGDRAIELCRQHSGRIAIIICDVKLRGDAGTSIALVLSQIAPGAPILFSSGTPIEGWTSTELADWELLRNSSSLDFLQKPFQARVLKSKILDLLAPYCVYETEGSPAAVETTIAA